jgi:hypothetical protein
LCNNVLLSFYPMPFSFARILICTRLIEPPPVIVASAAVSFNISVSNLMRSASLRVFPLFPQLIEAYQLHNQSA